MKSLGFLLSCFLVLGASFTMQPSVAKAQTAEATITISVTGSNADVSLFLRRTGGVAWKLGFTSFVFNFNNTALTFGSELVEGRWDNNTSSFYGDQFSSAFGAAARSVETDFNGVPGEGTDVPTTATLLGTLRFTITNSNANHNITWNVASSFVSDDQSNDVSGGITFTNPGNGSLPITLSSFTATAINQNRVRLNWSTLTETNNYGFEVQESQGNQNNYQTIPNSFVAGHGTTLEPQTYSFVDSSAPAGQWFYRLKQIDLDGTIHFTDGLQVDVLTGVAEKPLPKEFALDQNYPNPFNPSTRIEYAVPAASHVRLDVYNVIGQLVATLVDEVRPAGYYAASFNASSFSSGLYFYRMTAGKASFLKKMMLVK